MYGETKLAVSQQHRLNVLSFNFRLQLVNTFPHLLDRLHHQLLLTNESENQKSYFNFFN